MNYKALKLFNQTSDLLNRLSDFRDTFQRYSPEWFRADNIHAKAFKRYLRRYDWAFSYNPFKTLYAPEKTESGDSARPSAPVAALAVETGSHQSTQGQGGIHDKQGRKKSGFPSIPEEYLFIPKDHDRRLKQNRKKQRAEQGSGSTPDVRTIEYFDDVEIIHHVTCFSTPSALEGFFHA